MIILIAGLTACGKSYQAKLLAKELNYKYFCASDLLLGNIPNVQANENTEHFWVKKENYKYIDQYRDDMNIDIKLDSLLLEMANNIDNAVFDTRTLPWLYKGDNAIRIYLNPSIDDRAIIAYNSKEKKELSVDELRFEINNKDDKDILRFKKLYNIDISNPDKNLFDLIIDNGPLLPHQTHIELLNFIIEKQNLNKKK